MHLNKITEAVISLNRSSKRLLQIFIDVCGIYLCFIAAMIVRLDDLNFLANIYLLVAVTSIVPVTIISFLRLNLYKAVIRYIPMNIWLQIFKGSSVSAITLFIILQLFELSVPRSVPFLYFILLMSFCGLIRFSAKGLLAKRGYKGQKRVAVYGAGEAGRQLVKGLRENSEYLPIMFIDDDDLLQGVVIEGLPVLGFNLFKKSFQEKLIKVVLIAMPSINHSLKKKTFNKLGSFGLEVKILPGIEEFIQGKVRPNNLRGVRIEDLLGREIVPPKTKLLNKNIKGKTVLVTGAGGSIGSELTRHILQANPVHLIILDVSEYALYEIQQELENKIQDLEKKVELSPIIGSVQDKNLVRKIIQSFCIDTIYHAAAYKHVPLVEMNITEGLKNNFFGTFTLAKESLDGGVKNFILISTDKAVRPTNFMGAAKRLAELCCQSLAKDSDTTIFSIVRFGNVLGSSGSVVNVFKKQIEAGGPVTVTHPQINRYFMTISEAAQLVIQAGAMSSGGDVFVLDMGEPIKISELARTMIRLNGFKPYETHNTIQNNKIPKGHIEIKITGLRPGEKLYEELLVGNNPVGTIHPRIMTATETSIDKDELVMLSNSLFDAMQNFDFKRIREIIIDAPIDYNSQYDLVDMLAIKGNLKSKPKTKLKIIKN